MVVAAFAIVFVILAARGFLKAERDVRKYWRTLVGEYGVDYSLDRLARESRGAASGLASIESGSMAAMVRPISTGILVWSPANQSAVIPWDRIQLVSESNDDKSEITIEIESECGFDRKLTLPWSPRFDRAISANLSWAQRTESIARRL